MTEVVEKSIEVDHPVSTVYNQWTLFEEFPRFMEGVEKVAQIDDRHLRWRVSISGVEREFDAEITQQEPDQVIEWRAIGDTTHDGRVMFEEAGPGRTRINLRFEHDPTNLVEKAGEKLGIVDKRIENDLERFKEFLESRSQEEGGWRGSV